MPGIRFSTSITVRKFRFVFVLMEQRHLPVGPDNPLANDVPGGSFRPRKGHSEPCGRRNISAVEWLEGQIAVSH